jgi:hypothetical protein
MNYTKRLKGFPHIHYMNLDNRTDRRKYMEDQFDFWKLKYTRVTGSKFLASNVEDWASHYVVGKVTGIPAYALGNAITHLELMKKWISVRNDDYLLLMEDDYDLSLFEYWNFDWEYLMNRLPYDWDCIQLGYESDEFLPFFLHPKLRHTYFGPVLMTRDYVEKILSLHSFGDGKYRFDKTLGIKKFSKFSTTVDYFIGHTGRTYCIPLITTNITSPSTEFKLQMNRTHHEKSKHAYYYWWMKKHLNFTLDEFFTYGKPNDAKMIITIDS